MSVATLNAAVRSLPREHLTENEVEALIRAAKKGWREHRLTRYGGHGYHYILENIVPRMREKEILEKNVHTMLVVNPARMLTFA